MVSNITIFSIIDKEKGNLFLKYPNLKITKNKQFCTIEGILEFDVSMPNYLPYNDVYDIKIVLHRNFPKILPIVSVPSKKTINFHTYDDTTLCLGATNELKERLRENPSLLYLIEKIIIPFLYKASYTKKYSITPGGDLSHGDQGLAEYYSEKLNLNDKKLVLQFTRLLKNGKLKGHWTCPCGSGKKIRNCHVDIFKKFNSLQK